MIKLIALYQNELTKVTRRSVLYIMALIMTLLAVGVSLILHEAERSRLSFAETTPDSIMASVAEQREYNEAELQGADTQIEYLEVYDQENTVELEANYLRYGTAKAELSKLDWIESNLELYSQLGAMQAVLQPYVDLKTMQFTYERKPVSARTFEETAAYTLMKTMLSSFETRFERGTFVDLLEMMHEMQSMAGGDTPDSITTRVIAYELAMARNGESPLKVMTLSAGYREALEKLAALDTPDRSAPSVLLPSEREALENEVLIYEYRGQTPGGDPVNSAFANFYFYVLVSFAAFIIGILVIIVAGSQISSERSSGSIKSLILSPVRRWKIVTAKLLACLTVLLVFILLSWIVCTLFLRIVLGQSLQPHLFVSHGIVRTLPGWLYGLSTAALQNVGSLFFMLFAFMLSAVGLSTAASVGIGMGIRFGAQPLVFLLYQLLPDAGWMQFMPFQHFDLQRHILPINMNIAGVDAGGMMGMDAMSGPPTTLAFSLVWLGALSLVMLVSAYDSFTRKDL